MLCLVLPNVLLLQVLYDVDEEKNMRKCNDVLMFLMTDYIDNTRFAAKYIFQIPQVKRRSGGGEPGFPLRLRNQMFCFH